MLNWRRDPDFEQRKLQHEWRMKQLESEILRVRNDSEQIKRETEQLRRDNARQRALSALIKQHCFPDEFNSNPRQPIEPDSSSS
jgi:hypothetical protein